MAGFEACVDTPELSHCGQVPPPAPLEQNSSCGTLPYRCPQAAVHSDRGLSTNECLPYGLALGELSLGSDGGENA